MIDPLFRQHNTRKFTALKRYPLILTFAALTACNNSPDEVSLSTTDDPVDTSPIVATIDTSVAATPALVTTPAAVTAVAIETSNAVLNPLSSPITQVDGCTGSADPSTINASWMAGKWGLSLRIAGGHESYGGSQVDGFDVDAAVDVIASIPGVGWVQVNITNGAFGDRMIAPVPVLEDINPLAAPERDLFGEIATALKAKDIKVVAYIATQGPAMLKHGAEKAMDLDETITGLSAEGETIACSTDEPTVDDNQYSTYCSASMNRWRDKMYVLYPDTSETLYRKFEKAMAEHIVEDFATRYGSLIDGWWFDHTTAGDATLLGKAALVGNRNATLAFNEGDKVPLINNLPGLADYTFGHPNPVKGTVTQDEANEPMVISIENATDGILYGPDCEPALGHIFMPIQETWHTSSEIVFSENKGSEWQNRVLSSGGAMTWAIANQGTPGDANDPLVLAAPQVKLLKRIQANTQVSKHYPLDFATDEGITSTDMNFPYVHVRQGRVARFNSESDLITLNNYYGVEGTSPRAVSGWFRTVDDNGTIVKWGTANADEQWWLKVVNGKLKLIFHESNVVGSTVINDNQWHHFAMVAPTSANSLIRLYVDGARETETSTGTNFNTKQKKEVEVGGDFIGFIDDLRFYERSINKAEIEYLATLESSADLELALNLEFNEDSWRDETGLLDTSVYARKGSFSSKTILGNRDATRGIVAAFDGSGLITMNTSGDLMSSEGYNGVPGMEPRSVNAWIKTDDSDGIIVHWGGIAGNDGESWVVRTFDGQLRVSIDGASIQGSTSINDGHWHHIAVVAPTNDLNDTKLYIDGIKEDALVSGSPTTFKTNTLNDESRDVSIGAGFTGSIDNLMIHQRALSGAEVRSLAVSP